MSSTGPKKIILAVDDMPLNLAVIRTIQGGEFDVRLARSPMSALALLNRVKTDLILADIEMPEMSGFEFADRLRDNSAHPELKDIPVIFVTSHETQDILDQAASRGAAYVVKPIDPQALLEKVRAALEIEEKK
jgi:CheY-like chemotaxis protein